MRISIFISLLALCTNGLVAQENASGDDTRSKDWPSVCEKTNIISTCDGKDQPAYFYKSIGDAPRPLIISLHTWSNGYDQIDPLSWQCIKKNYNFIHPHFRGANHSFEACGSELVINDIEDAIDYAISNGNVDLSNMHIIGLSGGGYATLLAYMQTKHQIKTFSVWVPISNLVAWYNESVGRKNKYAKDIAISTTGIKFEDERYYIDEEEARERSPIFMETPVENRSKSKLFIYAGSNDGYTGPVPITHSLKFYNKVVGDFDKNDSSAQISCNDMIDLLASRSFPGTEKASIGGRKIHYTRNYKDIIQITIFEGGHECLDSIALDHIKIK